MIVEQLNTLLTISDHDSNEYLISTYLLNNWKNIVNYKMNEVLMEIPVSKSTLSRFCKTLGYRNFTDVQYQLFFEMSKVHPYKNNVELEEVIHLKPVLKNKKRIVVIGDENSMTPLLIYKQIFFNIGIEFVMKFKNSRPIDVLQEFCVSQEDIVIYVSLYKTNLELFANIFEHYIEVIDYLRKQDISYIYIGQMVDKKENEEYFLQIKPSSNVSDLIFQLCQAFEKIYALLSVENN
ncbi:MAG: hypothetical protein UFX20_02470 [Longibaculum muris]|uniref:hypothetical protein n=1 Tax=Longibaculum muris TaxID=1796628 RepID=UPI002E76AE52|nr:hypothetical protein [Longibaculum muris]MED9810948.1 hypothetical protein [Longibaculum muris]